MYQENVTLSIQHASLTRENFTVRESGSRTRLAPGGELLQARDAER